MEEEVKGVIFGMKKNTFPGLDRILIDFYQNHWSLVKYGIIELARIFIRGRSKSEMLQFHDAHLDTQCSDSFRHD